MSAETKPPHGLELVIEFVNTLDSDTGEDAFATSAGLRSWLVGKQLLQRDARATGERDLRHAIELREALRRMMLANNGAPADDRASVELERAARRGQLAVQFSSGSVRIAAARPGADGALAQLLAPVALAIGDGSWARVKACAAPDCQWAFYDRSRNRSGTWCKMAVCGNRTKVRAFRERAAAAGG